MKLENPKKKTPLRAVHVFSGWCLRFAKNSVVVFTEIQRFFQTKLPSNSRFKSLIQQLVECLFSNRHGTVREKKRFRPITKKTNKRSGTSNSWTRFEFQLGQMKKITSRKTQKEAPYFFGLTIIFKPTHQPTKYPAHVTHGTRNCFGSPLAMTRIKLVRCLVCVCVSEFWKNKPSAVIVK